MGYDITPTWSAIARHIIGPAIGKTPPPEVVRIAIAALSDMAKVADAYVEVQQTELEEYRAAMERLRPLMEGTDLTLGEVGAYKVWKVWRDSGDGDEPAD